MHGCIGSTVQDKCLGPGIGSDLGSFCSNFLLAPPRSGGKTYSLRVQG